MMKNHQSQQQEQQMKINCRKYPIITTNNNQNINLTINGHHDEENQFEEQSLNSVKKFVRTNNLSSNHHGKQQPTSKKMITKTTTGNHRTATRTQSFNNNHDLRGSFSSGTSLTTDQTIIGYGKSMDKKRFKSKRNKNGKIPYNHRFYLIKQQNYPPLYLDNSCNRKRIYRIIILGYPNVGKSSLIKQFRMHLQQTSETSSFNPANCNEMNDNLNLFIHFLELDSMIEFDMNNDYNCAYHSQRILKSQHQQQRQSSIIIDYQPDVYLIMFSVNDRESFNHVRKALIDIQRWDDVENKIIIIVANKCDLERSRCVNRKEARELATENNCKYIEISCTISHNIDTLLEGIGAQITLKNEQEFNHNQQHHQNHHHNHNNSNYPQQQQQQNRIGN
ncbi:gtp-binding protein rem 1-like [Dermatophagoides farinae]|uniref:Gtp-binding protein rem 1-like n=1 Tax=Dermatophagoides farinae TaxID=6954 RepID=A0A9D4P6R0_DERFA|nr:gtp-binding protein rem 1-like [Dermatophagoides farinae]